MAQKHSIVTVAGRNKQAAKMAANEKLVLTHIALGSGDRFSSGGETELENEVHRGQITGSGVEGGQANAVWFDLYVANDVNTFHAQEIGLFDEDGILFALSRFPEPVPKFGPDSSTTSDNTYRIIVVFSDTENVVVNISPVAGITSENLLQHLPFATDEQAADTDTLGKIMQVSQAHELFASLNEVDSRFLALIQNNPTYPDIQTLDKRLALTAGGAGSVVIDEAQTWIWRGLLKVSTDDFDLADRSLATEANKIYHLRWNAPGTGNAVPQADWSNGRFELVDLIGATPAEDDPTYDTTFDRMLVARIATDGANSATITTLKNAVELMEEVRWHTTTHGASHYEEGFSYSVQVSQRSSNSWGRLLLVPPAVHQINWARSPHASWQFGLMTSNSNSNDPVIANDNNGATLSDGSGTLTIINNRYEQYPIGRSDTNQPNTAFNYLGVQIKGKLDA